MIVALRKMITIFSLLSVSTASPIRFVGNPPSRQLRECEGDCDSDNDCVGSKLCWQRDKGDAYPPGCYGNSFGKGDYCYAPSGKRLKRIAHNPRGKLGECEGDCDSDSDCNTGLFCWHRGSTGGDQGRAIPPGCYGDSSISDWDYCYRPIGSNVLQSIALKPQRKLPLCAGDCDQDSDCMGDLTCFQRNNHGRIPYGCSGIAKGGWDYCVDCNNKCDVCQPLLEYRNKAIVCRDRITRAKNNAQDVKDKINVMHWLSKKAKSVQNTIAKIDRFMEANSHIIIKIPKVGPLVIKVSKSLDKFVDVMEMIGSKEPLLAKLKARLGNAINTLNFARHTVDMTQKIAHQGRNALITASKVSCCSSIDLTASNNRLTSAVIRDATIIMNRCATFNINVVLPSINPDLLNVIGAIADVVERVRKWIEDIKNAILRDADYFMCCENFGRFLGDVAEVFSDLAGMVTCVGTGAMGGLLDESFDVLLKSLSPLFDGLNNQIRKYNRFTTEFEKSVRVKVLGFKTSSKTVDDKTRGCKVEMPNISPFSSFDISADITMPKLSEIKFAFGSGQFNVQKVFGNIAAECEDAGKSLVTLDKFDCCDIAQRYPDGTTCLKGTSCKACKNPATWWAGAFMTKCGREPCWGGGTTCGAGTSCNSCCSGAHCPWYWAGFCKCK